MRYLIHFVAVLQQDAHNIFSHKTYKTCVYGKTLL